MSESWVFAPPDGAALVARGAEGLLERHAAAGLRLLELRDDLVVDDLRG